MLGGNSEVGLFWRQHGLALPTFGIPSSKGARGEAHTSSFVKGCVGDYLGVHDSPRYWHKNPVAQRAQSVWRAHTHVPGRSATMNERMRPRWPHFFLSPN